MRDSSQLDKLFFKELKKHLVYILFKNNKSKKTARIFHSKIAYTNIIVISLKTSPQDCLTKQNIQYTSLKHKEGRTQPSPPT